MIRAAVVSLVFLGACQTSAAPPVAPTVAVPTADEDDRPTPRKIDPADLPAPGRKPAASAIHWTALEPVWGTSMKTLRGEVTDLSAYEGKAVLVVNTASHCGQTKQYAALEALQKKYEARGFTVIGFPSNQFHQEAGSAEEIAELCSATYGVTFPMMEKIEVNGRARHPVYRALAPVADVFGYKGDIRWNFEKFVISADGTEVTRFSPRIQPEDPIVIAAIEAALPQR